MHITKTSKHTTINLDQALLNDAREVLHTSGIAQTIHRALEEVVRRERRKWLAEVELPDLTPAALDRMRAPRSLDPSA